MNTKRLLVQNEDYTWAVLILDEDNVLIDVDEPTASEIEEIEQRIKQNTG
jgi:hypothetical protein